MTHTKGQCCLSETVWSPKPDALPSSLSLLPTANPTRRLALTAVRWPSANRGFRDVPGNITREIQSNISSPTKIGIQKQGDYISMSLAKNNGKLKSSGGICRLPFKEPFYVGLGVCSHNEDTIEKALFSNVLIEIPVQRPDSLKKIEST